MYIFLYFINYIKNGSELRIPKITITLCGATQCIKYSTGSFYIEKIILFNVAT